ncbi:MAG: fibrobacter succinogenes major paralogous domain-containing protein, partial [Bacteroidota bacterium]
KVTRYHKGDTVFFTSGNSEWSLMDKGAFCNYDKNPAHGETYGHLYNWYAASDAKGICPDGWHVPTDTEWQKLIDNLGGDATAGGKLKATGTIELGTGLWYKPNEKATNESGFTALPGGYRNAIGSFAQLSYNARFWSSSDTLTNGWYRDLSYKYADVERNPGNKADGYSIRCIKDE